jgi:ribose transport system permease protein
MAEGPRSVPSGPPADGSEELVESVQSRRPWWRSRLHVGWLREYAVVVSFLALFITLSLASEVFLTPGNLLNILDQWSDTGIIACGGTLVIIAGGFDLSVGSIFALSGVVSALVTLGTGSPLIGWAAGIGVGTLWGGVNGLGVTVGRINPFIVTLATSIIITGFALALTHGRLIHVTTPGFETLGRGKVAGVRISILVFVGFAVLLSYVLSRTVAGRYIYAAGGNPEAARLSGVPVGWVRAATFAVSGLSAGLGGALVVSRVSTGEADTGQQIVLLAIAAIVIGGTSIFGGQGAVWRTVLGVLLFAMIGNGFNLLGIDAVYQQMFEGGIILAAVLFDVWVRRSA